MESSAILYYGLAASSRDSCRSRDTRVQKHSCTNRRANPLSSLSRTRRNYRISTPPPSWPPHVPIWPSACRSIVRIEPDSGRPSPLRHGPLSAMNRRVDSWLPTLAPERKLSGHHPERGPPRGGQGESIRLSFSAESG